MTKRLPAIACALLTAAPAWGQVELTGTYEDRLYEDYIERGPGSDLGDYTGMPMTDEARAKALSYTSNMPMTIERQCLSQAPWVGLYRPRQYRIWSVNDETYGEVTAWVIGGNYLRDTITIWMDGREHPSENAWHPSGGFATGKWEGNTLTVRMTHVKTAWIRRGNGIPGSDQTTFTVHITRHDDLLTVTTIQEDPVYLSEPHVVSRVWEHDPNARQGPERAQCRTANEIPYLEDSGLVPHYLPGGEPGRGLHGSHLQHPDGGRDGLCTYALSRVSQHDPGQLRAAGFMWKVLLRMDRTAGPAGRRTEPDLQ